jgi:hypothetical protein
MGDIYCRRCDEPWDTYHLRHDEPYEHVSYEDSAFFGSVKLADTIRYAKALEIKLCPWVDGGYVMSHVLSGKGCPSCAMCECSSVYPRDRVSSPILDRLIALECTFHEETSGLEIKIMLGILG